MVPPISSEEEEENDMVANLRAIFNERQCKRLSESITVNLPPSKKPCSESLCPEPILAIAQVPTPSTAIAGINPKPNKRLLSTEGTAHQEPGRPSFGPEHLSNESVECVASVPSHPKSSRIPNRERIVELMRQISFFTKRETPMHNMGVLFLVTWQVPVELKSDPSLTFIARLPFGTPDTVIFNILPIQDYTTFEMVKMVSRFPLLFMLP